MKHWLEILSSHGLPSPLIDCNVDGSLEKELNYLETIQFFRDLTNNVHFNLNQDSINLKKRSVRVYKTTIGLLICDMTKKYCED